MIPRSHPISSHTAATTSRGLFLFLTVTSRTQTIRARAKIPSILYSSASFGHTVQIMGAKKKGKAKKASADKEEVKAAPPRVLAGETDNWVVLNFNLLNWKYMNFSQRFKENTHVFTIKKLLRERHGRMEDMRICLNAFNESSEIADEMKTLLECGIKGAQPEVVIGAGGQPELNYDIVPRVEVIYDFKPHDFADPVLLYFKGK